MIGFLIVSDVSKHEFSHPTGNACAISLWVSEIWTMKWNCVNWETRTFLNPLVIACCNELPAREQRRRKKKTDSFQKRGGIIEYLRNSVHENVLKQGHFMIFLREEQEVIALFSAAWIKQTFRFDLTDLIQYITNDKANFTE